MFDIKFKLSQKLRGTNKTYIYSHNKKRDDDERLFNNVKNYRMIDLNYY